MPVAAAAETSFALSPTSTARSGAAPSRSRTASRWPGIRLSHRSGCRRRSPPRKWRARSSAASSRSVGACGLLVQTPSLVPARARRLEGRLDAIEGRAEPQRPRRVAPQELGEQRLQVDARRACRRRRPGHAAAACGRHRRSSGARRPARSPAGRARPASRSGARAGRAPCRPGCRRDRTPRRPIVLPPLCSRLPTRLAVSLNRLQPSHAKVVLWMVCDSRRGLVVMSAPLTVVVLAAGKGTRMKSGLPKVLHRVAGRPMIGHVLATAAALDPARVVVVLAPGMAEVEAELARSPLAPAVAIQEPALGTGHALMAARAQLGARGQGPGPVRRHAAGHRRDAAPAARGGRARPAPRSACSACGRPTPPATAASRSAARGSMRSSRSAMPTRRSGAMACATPASW